MNKFLSVFILSATLVGCATQQDDPAASLCRVAKKARTSGNSEASIKFYNRAIEINSHSANAYLGLAEVYIDTKLLDVAEDNLKKAEKNGANVCEVAYLRGKSCLLRGNIDKARSEFEKCKTPDCLNALGAIYDGRGEHLKAQQLYRQVISKKDNKLN